MLYIDVDTFIRGNLDDLYNISFGHNLIAGRVGRDESNNDIKINESMSRLELSLDGNYYNSGVLVMNLVDIRKTYSVDQILLYINCIIDKYDILYPDQDILNKIYDRRVAEFSMCYNYYATLHLKRKLFNMRERKSVKIVHFIMKIKPWYKEYFGLFMFEYYGLLRKFISIKSRITYWIYKPKMLFGLIISHAKYKIRSRN